jgi:ABC-type transport system involved in multi-copper enzyme maturation permease subunit
LRTDLAKVWVVAQHDLVDSFRSKRVIALFLLFVAGSVGGALMFLATLHGIEASATEMLGRAGRAPAALTSADLAKSPAVRELVAKLVGNEALARELLDLPPLAVFFGWMGFAFLPLVSVLVSIERITADFATGYARFAFVRVSRLSWSLGKLLAQMLLIAGLLLVAAVCMFGIGLERGGTLEARPTLLWLGIFSLRLCVFSFAYVGLALGLSQLTRSPQVARALAVAALIALSISRWILESSWLARSAPQLVHLTHLLPGTHEAGLWRSSWESNLVATAALVTLGSVYFMLGYRVRAGRDI